MTRSCAARDAVGGHGGRPDYREAGSGIEQGHEYVESVVGHALRVRRTGIVALVYTGRRDR